MFRSDVTNGDMTGVNTPAVSDATADTVPASADGAEPGDPHITPEVVWWRRWVEADRRAFGTSAAAAALPACPTVSESMDLHAAIVGVVSALVVIAVAVLTVLACERARARHRPVTVIQPAGQPAARPTPVDRTAVFPAVNHPPTAVDPWRWHHTNHNRSPR